MTVTPEIREEILAEFAKNPTRFSAFRTAKSVGVPIQTVIKVVDQNQETVVKGTVRFEGHGDPELADYYVARRRAMAQGWDNEQAPIAAARAAYEAGTHEMVTGRDGPWLILYLIPRKQPKPRPGYFLPESF